MNIQRNNLQKSNVKCKNIKSQKIKPQDKEIQFLRKQIIKLREKIKDIQGRDIDKKIKKTMIAEVKQKICEIENQIKQKEMEKMKKQEEKNKIKKNKKKPDLNKDSYVKNEKDDKLVDISDISKLTVKFSSYSQSRRLISLSKSFKSRAKIIKMEFDFDAKRGIYDSKKLDKVFDFKNKAKKLYNDGMKRITKESKHTNKNNYISDKSKKDCHKELNENVDLKKGFLDKKDKIEKYMDNDKFKDIKHKISSAV